MARKTFIWKWKLLSSAAARASFSYQGHHFFLLVLVIPIHSHLSPRSLNLNRLNDFPFSDPELFESFKSPLHNACSKSFKSPLLQKNSRIIDKRVRSRFKKSENEVEIDRRRRFSIFSWISSFKSLSSIYPANPLIPAGNHWLTNSPTITGFLPFSKFDFLLCVTSCQHMIYLALV